MRDSWTFDDLRRLTREAAESNDIELLGRIFMSDNFEPSLGFEGGLTSLICHTKELRRENRKRIRALYDERRAIQKRWRKTDRVPA